MSIAALESNTLPRNPVAQFARGLGYPLHAFRFLRRHHLWGAASLPFVINLLLLAAFVYVTWTWIGPWLTSVSAYLEALQPEMQFFKLLVSVVIGLFWTLAFFLVLGVNAMLLLLLGQAIASPFLDLLSEKVETLVLGIAPKPFGFLRLVRSVSISIGDLVGGVMLLAAVNVPVFLIGMTGVGAAPAAVASFAFSGLLLAHEFVGLSLSRHLVTYGGRWRVVRANTWVSLGFGTSSMFLLMVPGLNLLLLPLSAVGGTLLYCDLRRDRRLPPLKGRAAGELAEHWDS